jgi:hypothetical protein
MRITAANNSFFDYAPIRKDIAYDNIKKLDGDDAEKGITHIQIEMLPVRGRNGSFL